MDFNFKIEYVRGKKNVVADYLSRPVESDDSEGENQIISAIEKTTNDDKRSSSI